MYFIIKNTLEKWENRAGAPAEVAEFLTHLAVKRKVAASTQNQALSSILFLYREVLKINLPWLKGVIRAKKPERLPVVFSTTEIKMVLSQLKGIYWIMGNLMYGSGLRLMECLRLRIKDIDFDQNQIIVVDGKGQKDRSVPLPQLLLSHLKQQIDKVEVLHQIDLEEGCGKVYLPFALERKYPHANQ